MPRQTEPNANNAIGSLLQAMLTRSQVRSEHTQAIYGHPGLQPDILITAPGRAPVVIEAEYMPAASVEPEAKERLGLETESDGREIEAAIALRYPNEVSEAHNLHNTLSTARLSYCVFTENGGASRFPQSGWLDGSVEDLADMVRLVSVPQHAVDRATTTLQEGIDGAAKFLDEIRPDPSRHHECISRSAGDGQRAPDPAHGLRHHRQCPRVSRSHRRDARAHQNRSRMPAATMWTTRRVRCWQPGPSY